MEIKKRLEDFIIESLLNDGTDKNADFSKPLNDILDSLSIVQLIVFIEEEFKVDLLNDDVDVDVLNDLDSISSYIENKMVA